MKRRSLFGLAGLALGGALMASPAPAAAEWPERPITMVCPWGAGGGTDATARIVASLLEKELGVPVNVVNRTGGSGVVGHSALATAEPDGYTLGIITVEIGMMHWQGLTDLTWKDYTPLALFNEDPAGLQVGADAPYDTAQDLLDAIKAAGKGEMKASGTGQGGIWHLALAGMLQSAGMEPDQVQWVPSQGAAPGLQDLVAGGVEIVPSSVPEAKSLMDAGKVKSLALMADERNPAFPDVPTLKEATGIEWSVGAWRGFAAPAGLPQEISDKLVPILAKIHESADFRDFMNARGFGMVYAAPAEFEKFMAQRDESFGKVMKGLGLAK
ncbi:tripartite tricarboxylate transporter substrate binding protein [Geminicoccaceae bacterium 1502E]|nr:tripartite tricarboxylate transporter substrate binding protein [Geminicoccaceae bacterium 1502E]